jgi:hypothetical protein
MPLPSPYLDDRSFEQLLKDAVQFFRQKHPDSAWDDLSPSDPGMVLLELFAYITDVLLFRVNQVPERVHIALLNLIGLRLRPPSAARVKLLFTTESGKETTIRAGTRVTSGRAGAGEPPVFILAEEVVIPAGQTQGEGIAYHATQVVAELLGKSNGDAGQIFQLANSPVIAETADGGELYVGIEIKREDSSEGMRLMSFEGKTYRVWREVEHFVNMPSDKHVFRADRLAGVIEFAPAMQKEDGSIVRLAETPPAGAEIRAWYRYGGGVTGNVAADTLTVMKDIVAGVSVTNPARAYGGKDAEDLKNAMVRGPYELRSLERVITASDYENAARNESDFVTRAYAYPQAEVWSHGKAGMVELLVLPYIDEAQRQTISRDALVSLQEDLDAQDIREKIQAAIDARKPLGTKLAVKWVNTKSVTVQATIIARPQENIDALQARILGRIQRYINPYPTPAQDKLEEDGWHFGAPLRASAIYNLVLKEAGVQWVEQVRLKVDEVPNKDVTSLVADLYSNEDYQPATFYAASGTKLFRSLNNAKSWELLRQFDDGEDILLLRSHQYEAGWLAIITWQAEKGGMNIFLSEDSGESWFEHPIPFGGRIHDAAWLEQEKQTVLLLATEKGLIPVFPKDEMPIRAPLSVDRGEATMGFYSVIVYRDEGGTTYVAVAAANRGGVYLSSRNGRPNSFRHLMGQEGKGLRGKDVRTLTVQKDGTNLYLWAGTASKGGQDVGEACYVWHMQEGAAPLVGWKPYTAGWQGGTCRDILIRGKTVYAVSHRQGLMRLDNPHGNPNAKWKAAGYRSQLPLRPDGEFEGQFVPLLSGAISRDESKILVGTEEGVFLSETGEKFEFAASNTFIEDVSLPKTWLFISGAHEIVIRGSDEGR